MVYMRGCVSISGVKDNPAYPAAIILLYSHLIVPLLRETVARTYVLCPKTFLIFLLPISAIIRIFLFEVFSVD
jgi:hypothetical protein